MYFAVQNSAVSYTKKNEEDDYNPSEGSITARKYREYIQTDHEQ